MKIDQLFLRVYTSVLGILVLLSYYIGLDQTNDPAVLWGGIPTSWTTLIIPWMFVAAAGFLIYYWKVLYNYTDRQLHSLHWPWMESDGKGNRRLFVAFTLFLIPSALWLESTRYHLNNSYNWTSILVVSILGLVALGNIIFILLAYGAVKDGIKDARTLLISSLMISIQVVFNDFILWSLKFPW